MSTIVNGKVCQWPEKPVQISDEEAEKGAGNALVTKPNENPCSVYPSVGMDDNTIDTKLFHLPGHQSLGQVALEKARSEALRYIEKQKSTFIGYQCNTKLDFSDAYAPYLDTHVNNIGDPFVSGNFTLNSKWMERAVLDYYAALWNARWPHNSQDPDSYWGYVMTMGSTEANLYGLWNARDYLAGKLLLIEQQTDEKGATTSTPRLVYRQAYTPRNNANCYTPIAFFSQDTHYSFAKAMRVLSINTFYVEGTTKYPNECPLPDIRDWPEEVPSQPDGTIDLDALTLLVDFFAKRGYPILVSFNYGTTFKGSYDDVEKGGNILMPIFEKYGLIERHVCCDESESSVVVKRTGYWIHVDGALGATYMPFLQMAHKANLVPQCGPNFDFRLPFVHSITMSGHKWPGVPMPCGIYMTKTKHQLSPPGVPEYIGSQDTTFAGSRNGLSAMLLWDHLARVSYKDQIQRAVYLEALADYTVHCLKMVQECLQLDLYIERSPLSLSVIFRKPNESIIFKYSLSTETYDGKRYAHVYMMHSVTDKLVDSLIQALLEPDAFIDASPSMEIIEPLSVTKANGVAFVPYQGRGFH